MPQFLGIKASQPHTGARPEGWLIILEHSEIIKASSISPCSFVLLQSGLMGLLSPAQTHSLFLIAHKSQPQNNPSFCLDLLKYLSSPPAAHQAIPSLGMRRGTNRWHRLVRSCSCSGCRETADVGKRRDGWASWLLLAPTQLPQPGYCPTVGCCYVTSIPCAGTLLQSIPCAGTLLQSIPHVGTLLPPCHPLLPWR